MMNCPLCHKLFPLDDIEVHADFCLTRWDQKTATTSSHGNDDRPISKKQRVVPSPPSDLIDFGDIGLLTDDSEYDTEPLEAERAKMPETPNSPQETQKLTSNGHEGRSPTSRGRYSATPVKKERVQPKIEPKTSPSKASATQSTTRSTAVSNFFSPRRTNKRPADMDEDASRSSMPAAVNFKPLADQMRPKSLVEFIGQENILSPDTMLRRLIESNDIPSMILWGPPGCGKTSLAHIVAANCRTSNKFTFVTMSATNSGISDVKDVIKRAKNDQSLLKRGTILFVDEIHRFNKMQQDIFMPHVEDGTITLIGATTENPSFSLNSSLLSRCRVFVLEKLSVDAVIEILQRAAKKLDVVVVENSDHLQKLKSLPEKSMETAALKRLAELSDGDARVALNSFSIALKLETRKRTLEGPIYGERPFVITIEHVQESLQRSHLLYDRQGDEHFNCISALHKSMRGSDGNAALYWLGRILEGGEDPRYVSRRLIRFASEDVGLADPQALHQAVAAHEACQFIGMPECDVVLAQCVVYLSEAPKSVRVYDAYCKVKECIASHKGPLPGVPIHLRNAITKLDRELGHGRGYIYNPHHTAGPVNQDYLPAGLKDRHFLKCANHTANLFPD